MNQYQEIVDIVKGLSGNENLYFDSALEIKRTPHDYNAFYAWGVCVSPKDKIHVMDYQQCWWPVEEADVIVTASLYQRIKVMNKKTA